MNRAILQRVATGIAAIVLFLPAAAFHNGGTGRCDGCHISHTNEMGGDELLLIAETPSDVCLVCHAVNVGSVFGVNPILGPIDALKLRSCMTLFARADPTKPVFAQVLRRFFFNRPDEATERLLDDAAA